MSLCDNCYHNQVCEYQSCYKKDCLHYKNEHLIYELPLEIGTVYYQIETTYDCNYDKECEFNYSCNICPYDKERLSIVRYAYYPTLFSKHNNLGKIYLSEKEAKKELEKLNDRQENKK